MQFFRSDKHSFTRRNFFSTLSVLFCLQVTSNCLLDGFSKVLVRNLDLCYCTTLGNVSCFIDSFIFWNANVAWYPTKDGSNPCWCIAPQTILSIPTAAFLKGTGLDWKWLYLNKTCTGLECHKRGYSTHGIQGISKKCHFLYFFAIMTSTAEILPNISAVKTLPTSAILSAKVTTRF